MRIQFGLALVRLEFICLEIAQISNISLKLSKWRWIFELYFDDMKLFKCLHWSDVCHYKNWRLIILSLFCPIVKRNGIQLSITAFTFSRLTSHVILHCLNFSSDGFHFAALFAWTLQSGQTFGTKQTIDQFHYEVFHVGLFGVAITSVIYVGFFISLFCNYVIFKLNCNYTN